METQEKLGTKIKTCRKELGFTSQEKFASYIEMNRSYYSSIESSKRNSSLKNLEKIAKGLNMTLSELLPGIADSKNTSK